MFTSAKTRNPFLSFAYPPVGAGCVALWLVAMSPLAFGGSQGASLSRASRAPQATSVQDEANTPVECGAVDITQSTDPVTVSGPGFAVACVETGNNCTVDNEFARSFDLSVGPTAGQAHFVRCVEYGVESVTNPTAGSVPLTINLYEDTSGGAPDVASLVLLGSIVDAVPDGTALTLRTVDFTASNVVIAADATLVVGVFSPDQCILFGPNHNYFNGANGSGQSGPSYLLAPGCGIADFDTLANIGFPGQHMVMTVELDPTGGSLDPPTVGNDTCHLGAVDLGTPCSTDADCGAGEACGLKSRHVTVNVPTVAARGPGQSIKVTIAAMTECAGGARDGLLCVVGTVPDDCPGGGTCVSSPRVGEVWWAGASTAGNLPNPPNAALTGAELLCEASPSNAQTWPTGDVHLFGGSIVPGSLYEVRMCDAAGSNCSLPLVVATGKWGEVVAPFVSAPSPNFGDVSAVVDKFRNIGSAPDMPRTDLVGPGNPPVPNTPDHSTNFIDIPADVDAFRGFAYPFTVPACP